MKQWPPNLRRSLSSDEMYRYDLTDIISRICSVRASFKDGSAADFPTIIEICTNLDNQLVSWSERVPLSMSYSTIFLDTNPEEIYGGHYHVYNDFFKAYLWNGYRLARILTNQMLMKFLSSEVECTTILRGPRITEQYQKAASVLREMIAEVLASVPYHLGFQYSTKIPPPAVGGLLLTWPLFKLAAVEVAAGRIRDWAIGRLDYIRQTMGIQQAHALAEVLRKRSLESISKRNQQAITIIPWKKIALVPPFHSSSPRM
jgi:hypothetical protein